MIRRHLLALLASIPLVVPVAGRAAYQEPTGPQPKLPTEKLAIVTRDGLHHDFEVEMATTEDEQRIGLMFRTAIPDGTGMLFDWVSPRLMSMWMENCPVGEDMLFIGSDGTIRHIAENTVPQSTAIVSSVVPVRATLEVAAGTAEKLDIRVGDKVLNRIFGNAP